MKHVKSERLKKLETELNDLEQWLKLGLVPKKDREKHLEELQAVRSKIEEEKERLNFLKESGEAEEYVTPKRNAARTAYTDMPTIPDIDAAETGGGVSESNFDVETEGDSIDAETSGGATETEQETEAEEDDARTDSGDEKEDKEADEEESYFSDRNRWRRGGIKDPDADEW